MRILLLMMAAFSAAFANAREKVTVGSKIFSESGILAEIAAQTLEGKQVSVDRKFGMGSTGILLESLKAGAIDLYPDYSGTLSETILKGKGARSIPEIRNELEKIGLTISDSLGFDDTYAIAVTESFAAKHNLRNISDLKAISGHLRAAFSYEFMSRNDGFRGLKSAYGLKFSPQNIRRMEHSLVYEAIHSGAVDVIEVYSTDANIEKFKLAILTDDRSYFPGYKAVWVANLSFTQAHPDLWQALKSVENKIGVKTIREMNAKADIDKIDFGTIVSGFLHKAAPSKLNIYQDILQRTLEHLWLVCVSVLFSSVVGIPLGILAGLKRRFGKGLLAAAALLQTIPSLALLCFLIPVFGVGKAPAIVALCLYSLLPVVLSTATGIAFVDEKHLENARAFGMSSWQILTQITIPLASPTILAGFKTATIVSIGTATLAAFVGAGGYGALIISGLSLNDTPTILMGAIPAALMAVAANFLLDALENVIVPKGLRQITEAPVR